VGTLFVTAGMAVFVFGLNSYRVVVKKLKTHVEAAVPIWFAVVLTVVLVLGSMIELVSIILDR
jgi:hypothetical protein